MGGGFGLGLKYWTEGYGMFGYVLGRGLGGPGLYANTLRVVFGAELMCTSRRKQVGEGVSDTFTWILHSW